MSRSIYNQRGTHTHWLLEDERTTCAEYGFFSRIIFAPCLAEMLSADSRSQDHGSKGNR